MINSFNKIFIIFIFSFVSSCSLANNEGKMMADIKPKLLEISKKYILNNYPDSTNVFEFKVVIEDDGEKWKVTYELPELWLGGVPVIFISKDSLKVVDAYHTQ